MFLQVQFLGPVLAAIFLVILIFVGLKVVKNIFSLAINAVLGLALLFVLNYLQVVSVPINIWSVLIAAFGGIIGVIVLAALYFFGITF